MFWDNDFLYLGEKPTKFFIYVIFQGAKCYEQWIWFTFLYLHN